MFTKQLPWAKAYPPDVTPRFIPPQGALHTLLAWSAAKHGARTCTYFLGKTQTYAEIHAQAEAFAAALQRLGLTKGDRVGICLPNCPYYIAAYFGIVQAGCIVVNFNPLYTGDELLFQARDSGIKMMVTLDVASIYPKITNLLGRSPVNQIIVCSLASALPPLKSLALRLFKRKELVRLPQENARILHWEKLLRLGEKPTAADINPTQDIAVLQYTGGTTGKPKGAALTHTNILSNTEQVRLWLGDPHPQGERFMAVLPFFHVFAMTAVMNLALTTGSELILLPRFDVKQVLRTIHRRRPTIFPGVPTLFATLNQAAGEDHYDLSSIRYCISGGASLPKEVQQDFIRRTGCTLVEGYGLTEASPVALCNPRHTLGKAGSIGVPLPGTEVQIRRLGHINRTVKPGEQGEIFIRGPQVMQGYWNCPAVTREVLHNGWLRTGDVGYMDAEGYVFLTDRVKDIIITNGYNVYPRQVEAAFYQHPAVSEVTVIGIADPHKGEVPKAFVRLRYPGISAAELLSFAQQRLNPLERPVAVEIRDALPKTLIGKLSKKELVAEEAAKVQNNKETRGEEA